MRDLLGGKGANVAEMTRVLGKERVPAGFTITTEACVAYMDGGELPRRARGAGRRRARAARGAGRQAARRPRGPAARVGAQRGARVDAGDARHGPQPGPERRVRGGARRRPLRLGLLPALRADVRERVPRHQGRALRGPDQGAQGRGRGEGGRGPRRGRPEGAHRRLPARLPGRDRRGLPAGAARAAAPGDRRRVRLVDGRARRPVPAHQRDPGRVGHGGERAADGVREPRRSLVQRRGVLARRDHRRAEALRRLPAERPGRGRGVGRAHTARPARDEGPRCRTPTTS